MEKKCGLDFGSEKPSKILKQLEFFELKNESIDKEDLTPKER